jgi:hypothetical protein
MFFGSSFIWLQSPLMRHKLLKSAYGAIIQCLYVPKLLDRCHCWCIKPQILAFRRDKNLKDILVHKKHNSLFFKQEHKCEPCSRNCALCPYVRNTHTFTNFEGKTFNVKNYINCTTANVVYTGARCVGKKNILYNTTRGRTHLLPFFLSRRVKLIVTSERLNIFKTIFSQSKSPLELSLNFHVYGVCQGCTWDFFQKQT